MIYASGMGPPIAEVGVKNAQPAPPLASPRARNTDPVSSHEAANRQRKGRAYTDGHVVFSIVKIWPGSTSAELANLSGRDRHMIARRLPDLEERGLVRRGEIRKCKAHGTNAVSWWAK